MKKYMSIALLLSLSNMGCAVQEMAQAWQLDRLRILGVQADKAEASPGDTVSFESLVYYPDSESLDGVVWFGCLGENATSFGCTIDPTILEGLNEPPTDSEAQIEWFTELQEAGLLGFEPALAPSWTIPDDALDMLEEVDQVEGLSAFLNLTAIPSDAEEDTDIEVAFKRFPVSTNLEPNQNPLLKSFVVNGTTYTVEESPVVQANETVTLDVVFEDSAIETYTYTNPDTGISETRTETPYLSWYTEGGEFDNVVSLPPYTNVDWVAPPEASTVDIIVTVRDRRGGMDWLRVEVSVEGE